MIQTTMDNNGEDSGPPSPHEFMEQVWGDLMMGEREALLVRLARLEEALIKIGRLQRRTKERERRY